MAPQLRVLVSSTSAYPPTTDLAVNSITPTPIDTPRFKGEISVYIKDFNGENKGGDGSAYFGVRQNMTYGIVVRGRFLEDIGGDDVVFGNVFEKPIRDSLPWGTAVATKFIYFVEPSIELDIYADKPSALSPALASMNYITMTRDPPTFRPPTIDEDSLALLKELHAGDQQVPEVGKSEEKMTRRKWFSGKENRDAVKLGKDVYMGMEFCNGLLDFNTLSATLPPPFHLSFPLIKYWDGQPVTYVCRRRSKNPVDAEGVFWSVAFEIVDREATEQLKERGGAVVHLGEGGGASDGEKGEKVVGNAEGDTSDDLD